MILAAPKAGLRCKRTPISIATFGLRTSRLRPNDAEEPQTASRAGCQWPVSDFLPRSREPQERLLKFGPPNLSRHEDSPCQIRHPGGSERIASQAERDSEVRI